MILLSSLLEGLPPQTWEEELSPALQQALGSATHPRRHAWRCSRGHIR